MKIFRHKFVEFVPECLEPDVLYVSLRFSLVSHQCACGCGEEVVTPLAPRDWQLIFNGETISLFPSIGNWSFQCRSHYWIDQNHAVRARDLRYRPDRKRPKDKDVAAPRWAVAKGGSITDRLLAKLKSMGRRHRSD